MQWFKILFATADKKKASNRLQENCIFLLSIKTKREMFWSYHRICISSTVRDLLETQKTACVGYLLGGFCSSNCCTHFFQKPICLKATSWKAATFIFKHKVVPLWFSPFHLTPDQLIKAHLVTKIMLLPGLVVTNPFMMHLFKVCLSQTVGNS